MKGILGYKVERLWKGVARMESFSDPHTEVATLPLKRPHTSPPMLPDASALLQVY